MSDPRILVLIPARMAATRLPGKPLLDIGGLPMIVHVLRRAEAARIGRVAVATDTPEIAAAVTAAGGQVVMTSPGHPSGSDRIHEAMKKPREPKAKRIGSKIINLNDPYGDAITNLQNVLAGILNKYTP